MMTNIEKHCLVCNKSFVVHPNPQNAKQKYCCRACYNIANVKKNVTWGASISKGKMGHGWPAGFHERQSIAQKKRFKTEVPWNKGKYKTGKISYASLHNWVRSVLGKPSVCKNCGSSSNMQWANVSHEYKQEIDDWIPLCAGCHVRYDGTINNLNYIRKKKI